MAAELAAQIVSASITTNDLRDWKAVWLQHDDSFGDDRAQVLPDGRPLQALFDEGWRIDHQFVVAKSVARKTYVSKKKEGRCRAPCKGIKLNVNGYSCCYDCMAIREIRQETLEVQHFILSKPRRRRGAD